LLRLKVTRNSLLVIVPYCETFKLREHPKALTTKSIGKLIDGQGNDLGYGKNVKDRYY